MRSQVRSLRRNLMMNYQALGPGQRWIYRLAVRPFMSPRERLFFEGIPGVGGQLYLAERRALHDSLVRRAPTYAFEIGTYNGAGSTFVLAHAFSEIGSGKLVTLEADASLHAAAERLYQARLPGLRPHVEFVQGSQPGLFESYLRSAGSAEFVFLDGAEHADQSVEQYQFFEPWFRPASILAAHDWNTEKMRRLKQVIADSHKWRLVLELGEPVSVGFAIHEFIGSCRTEP